MKTTLILSSITVILTLGTLAIVRAQDDQAAPEPATAAPETETAVPETETTAPVDTAPVDTAPVDTAPVDTAPVDTAPVEETVAASVPGIRTNPVVEEKLLGGIDEVIAIPVAAVFAEGKHFFVLARNEESGTDFREVEVTLGRTDGWKVEVTEGVQPGDEVLTVSVSQLRFPDFGSGNDALCGTVVCEGETCSVAACGTTCHGKAGGTTGTCTVRGGESCEAPTGEEVDLTFPADELFNGAPGSPVASGACGPFFSGGPAFCPTF